MSTSEPKILSELEGVSLGIVRRRQPCTAYSVRNELKRALSSHWRASAGSLYPLLTRLEAAGFLIAETDTDDGRGRKLLRITRSGRQALRRWILAGVDHEMISSVTDPARSRMFFLQSLAPKQRLRYLDRMIDEMQAYLEETRAHLLTIDERRDRFNYYGALGGMRITEARLDWLREVRKDCAD